MGELDSSIRIPASGFRRPDSGVVLALSLRCALFEAGRGLAFETPMGLRLDDIKGADLLGDGDARGDAVLPRIRVSVRMGMTKSASGGREDGAMWLSGRPVSEIMKICDGVGKRWSGFSPAKLNWSSAGLESRILSADGVDEGELDRAPREASRGQEQEKGFRGSGKICGTGKLDARSLGLAVRMAASSPYPRRFVYHRLLGLADGSRASDCSD